MLLLHLRNDLLRHEEEAGDVGIHHQIVVFFSVVCERLRKAGLTARTEGSSKVEEDSCPPKEFIGLKNGGKKNNYIVEGILFQSGRLWLRDQRWVVRKFSQL
jgi:hypothetical protein